VYLGALEPPKAAASAEGSAATADEPLEDNDPDFADFIKKLSMHQGH
jgi:hypothetical protein